MVTRVVAAWYQLGQDDETKFPRKPPNFSSWTDDRLGVLAPGSTEPAGQGGGQPICQRPGEPFQHRPPSRGRRTVLLKNEDRPAHQPRWLSPMPGSRHAATRWARGRQAPQRQAEDRHLRRGCRPWQGPQRLQGPWLQPRVRLAPASRRVPVLPSSSLPRPPWRPLRSQLNTAKVELFEFLTNKPPSEATNDSGPRRSGARALSS